MSFFMSVQEDKVLPPGPYRAVLDDIEIKQTAHGERLMWTFGIPSENAQVVGFSSLNEKTSAKAYLWASAITDIDPEEGWGPNTVKGKRCTIHVDTARDAQGRDKNKVQGVTPLHEEPAEPDHNDGGQGQKQDDHNTGHEEDDFGDIPF